MLLSLSIKNFILLSDLDIEFKEGLTVITGETGAGKSILLDALLFCLGSKFSTDIIKNDEESCSVTASFLVANNDNIREILRQLDIEYQEELIIKRTLTRSLKKRFLVNDQIVTQKTIEELAKNLFEIHAQDSLTALIDSKSHLEILDSFAEVEQTKSFISINVKKWHELKREIEIIHQEKLNNENEIDYLNHAIDEITKAQIVIGEEKNLMDIKSKLLQKDKEIKLLEDILSPLEHEQIDHAFSKSSRIINRASDNNERFSQVSQLIEQAYSNVEQAKTILKNQLREIKTNEYNLEEIEDRLYNIKALVKKYKADADEMGAFLNSIQEKYIYLTKRIDSANTLNDEFIKIQNEYENLANELTYKRINAAKILESKIQDELAVLKMEKAVFRIPIINRESNIPNINGNDFANFIASTNPGTPLSPIDKIASGGELSRIMLALKVALFDKGSKDTLVFDEIDTGIGGVVADSVGDKLKYLGKACQLIVITHQPQVACKADNHILVIKQQLDNTTKLEIKTLNIKERQYELARMISGKMITESSLKAATDLLN